MDRPTLYEITPLMEEVLQNGGSLHLQPMGYSMLPFIRPNKDEVILSPVSFPVQSGKIYFYRRNNGALVLHRCVKVFPDGNAFRGDNQIHTEYGIQSDQLIGEVTSVCRNYKNIFPGSFTYSFYRRIAFPCCATKKIYYRAVRTILRGLYSIKKKFL